MGHKKASFQAAYRLASALRNLVLALELHKTVWVLGRCKFALLGQVHCRFALLEHYMLALRVHCRLVLKERCKLALREDYRSVSWEVDSLAWQVLHKLAWMGQNMLVLLELEHCMLVLVRELCRLV